MVDSNNLYDILGVSKDSSDSDIKKAYHKAALRWHPDKNANCRKEAEVMFKKITEAYDILRNPGKKHLYNLGGIAAVNGDERTRASRDAISVFDIFNRFFGSQEPLANFDSRLLFRDFYSSGSIARVATSVSTVTKIVDGRRVTITEKKVRKPDGTIEVTRNQISTDGNTPPASRSRGFSN